MERTVCRCGLASAAVASPPCEVAAVRSEQGLWELKEDWESLQRQASSNVFTTWGWMWSWWRSLGRHEPATTMFIITVRQAGRLTALLPLVRRHTRWGRLRKLEFPDLIFADRMGPLIAGEPKAELVSVFRFLDVRRHDWDLLMLRRLRVDSGIADAISDSMTQTRLFWRKREDEAYLCLPISNRFEQMQSSSSGQNYRRKLRRMERAGACCRIVEHPERELHLLDRMADIERRRMVQGRPAGLLLAQHSEFFQEIFQNCGPSGWLYVGVLEQGAELVAYELGFRCDNELWMYTKGFDPRFGGLSPGNLLSAAIVDYGFEHKFINYDLLRGREEFKQRLTDRVREHVRFEIWNRSRRSLLGARLFFGLRVALIRKWWELRHQPIHPDL
jgi:CelD/BcsL family acetyltransferase involved in cellulose biosynthesis